eukprot:gene28118-31232_t
MILAVLLAGLFFSKLIQSQDVPAAISAGGRGQTCALFDNGRVKCWGDFPGFQEYYPGTLPYTLDYVALGTARTATSIDTGDGQACAILENGDLKCWGYNSQGQLGLNDRNWRMMGVELIAVNLGTGRTATAVAAGLYHTCAILDNVDLGTGRTAKTIAFGMQHTCTILDNGDLKCWGENRNGQLGLGDKNPRVIFGNSGSSAFAGDGFLAVDLGTGRTAIAVAGSWSHTCAILDNGALKCWGANSNGQLGLGDTESRGGDVNEMGDNLTAVDLGTGRTATAITVGSSHTCALLDNGSVKCWGRNEDGELGLGNDCDRGGSVGEMGDNLPSLKFIPPLSPPPSPPPRPSLPPTPPGVDLSKDVPAIVTAGLSHTCLLFTNGRVKCWGEPTLLGLGRSSPQGTEPLPYTLDYIALGVGRTVTTIVAGRDHTCAILDNGQLKCWGYNVDGQLGISLYNNETIGDEYDEMGDGLLALDLGTSRTTTAIAAGGRHTCALLDDGNLKCWGSNNFGQLGRSGGGGCLNMGDEFPAVDLGAGQTATAIAAGSAHTCALLVSGVKCWGYNNLGQLGTGSTETRADAGDNLPVLNLGDGRKAIAIAAGEYHTCAILDNKALKCWGSNIAGELGLGDTVTRTNVGVGLPAINLGTNRTATAISAGAHHTCAILDNGSLKCWGYNEFGQLGLSDTASRGGEEGQMGDNLLAVDLGTNRTAIAITSRGEHNCATLDDGSIKCWGQNSKGQLGLSDASNRGDDKSEMGDILPALQINPPLPPTRPSQTNADGEADGGAPSKPNADGEADGGAPSQNNANGTAGGEGPSQPNANGTAGGGGPSLPNANGTAGGGGPSLPNANGTAGGGGPSQPNANGTADIRPPSQLPNTTPSSSSQPLPQSTPLSPPRPLMPPKPPAPPFPPKPPARPYGTAPMPTITATIRVPNEEFASIPTEVSLIVTLAACTAIDADPMPFKLAYQEQVASDWMTSNPDTPIKNGDVEVISVIATCPPSRRSHRSLLEPSSSVITKSSINLPAGVVASDSMLDSFKQKSEVSMLVSSFASDFGVETVTTSVSSPEMKTTPGAPPLEIGESQLGLSRGQVEAIGLLELDNEKLSQSEEAIGLLQLDNEKLSQSEEAIGLLQLDNEKLSQSEEAIGLLQLDNEKLSQSEEAIGLLQLDNEKLSQSEEAIGLLQLDNEKLSQSEEAFGLLQLDNEKLSQSEEAIGLLQLDNEKLSQSEEAIGLLQLDNEKLSQSEEAIGLLQLDNEKLSQSEEAIGLLQLKKLLVK